MVMQLRLCLAKEKLHPKNSMHIPIQNVVTILFGLTGPTLQRNRLALYGLQQDVLPSNNSLFFKHIFKRGYI